MRSSTLPRVALVAVVATVAAAGCSVTVSPSRKADASGADRATGGSVGADAGPVAGGTGTGGTGSTTGTGGTGSSGTGSSGGGAPTPKPTTASADNGPRIAYFRVRQQPSCPSGTTVNPIPGSPVVLEWQVTNVDRVALSVDGPGIYGDDYAPTGTETLTFPCDGAEGSTQKHTYQLTVTNAHGKQTKTLTVSARVSGIAPV